MAEVRLSRASSFTKQNETIPAVSAIDPFVTRCYKCQFCTGSFGDHRNLSDRPECKIRRGQAPILRFRFAVEACSEFRKLRLACAALGVLGRGMSCRKAVPVHVCRFLKTDLIWRTQYAHLVRQCCVPRMPCGIWFPEKDSCRGHADYCRRWRGLGSTCSGSRRRSCA